MNEQLGRDVSKKAYGVAMILGLIALIIFGKIIMLQAFPKPEILEQGEQLAFSEKEILPARGQILSSDGSLLATSVPIYEMCFDAKAPIEKSALKSATDSIAQGIHKILGEKSEGVATYKKRIKSAKGTFNVIAKNIDYNQKKAILALPFVKRGKYKSGFYFPSKQERKKPFGSLAARTIGLERDANKVGLELCYDEILKGKAGRQRVEKMAGGQWRPINDEYIVEPEPGMDIVATIDVHLQDVAHTALLRQLNETQADWGCAVVMEVETGYVRAIANLTYEPKSQTYLELLNNAVESTGEPGSTFKLMSMMAMFEESKLSLSDSVHIGMGVKTIDGLQVHDSHPGNDPNLFYTVKEIFQKSSNVGTAQLVQRIFKEKQQVYLDRLNSFGLGKPLGVELEREAKPRLAKEAKYKKNVWDGFSLYTTSYGYATSFTPLQILAFYNAVANKGTMVRPLFVQEIQKNGRTIEKKLPVVLNKKICSDATLDKCMEMMKGVAEDGGTVATVFKSSPYKIAGKTGTARVDYAQGAENLKYRASFVGFFPAENPKYSCIVVIHNPKNGAYYGGAVAAPVVKDLADKVYSTRMDFHEEKSVVDSIAVANALIPISKNGNSKDLQTVFSALNIPMKGDGTGEYVRTNAKHKEVEISNAPIESGKVPNVVGMGLQDALFLLEKQGLKVQIQGVGTVKRQSVPAGTPSKNQKYITIELS